MLRSLLLRVKDFVFRERLDRESQEELVQHVELLAAEKARAGLDPAEALRQARLELGNPQEARERLRDGRSGSSLDAAGKDLGYAWRQLRSRPGFTAACLVTVMLGVGASTALFAVVDQSTLPEQVGSISAQPQFASWTGVGAQAVVMGQVQQGATIESAVRVWDTQAQAQVVGKSYQTDPSNFRRVAHIISDAIYSSLTGEGGYFDSRVAFVAESGPKANRVKRLAIMDQDGKNVRLLSKGGELVLTPRFSPTNQEITFMSYAGDQPRVFLMNLGTGQRELVGDFPGMTFAPRFSPDGQRVIMSLQSGGNSSIYEMDLRSRQKRRRPMAMATTA